MSVRLLAALLLVASTTSAEDLPPDMLVRRVELPARAGRPAVVVTFFFTGGHIAADASNVQVADRAGRTVPWRLLQLGPGDFARLAFVPTPGTATYEIRYGVRRDAPAPDPFPIQAGLLFEARRWTPCDLNRLDSVREAFARAEPMGADLVPAVYHRRNPVDPAPGAFLSRYQGTLYAPRTGTYQFFTSSQDCSFLLIDGREVVAWPGWHGPVADARIKGQAQLSAGPHAFEYLHAASSVDTCMVAAWQPPGTEKPEPIPPSAFGSDRVATLRASSPLLGGTRRLRDFLVAIEGEVPLPDPAPPMIRVRFDASESGSRVRWDFGDGQKAAQASPTHIYLLPGLYTVRLSVVGEPPELDAVHRVAIVRPALDGDKETTPVDTLAAYLPLVARYDVASLAPPAVAQLVQALLLGGERDRAVSTASQWLAQGPRRDDPSVLTITRRIAPLLRDGPEGPAKAREAWLAAATASSSSDAKAECLLAAADLALNDLLEPRLAAEPLRQARSLLATASSLNPLLGARLERLQADALAAAGEGPAARSAYALAAQQAAAASRRGAAEREAWRGARSRAVEALLVAGDLPAALQLLRDWVDEDPEAMVEGYLPWLRARLHAARAQPHHVLAEADRLRVVNPNSPYADRLLFLAAEALEKLERPSEARATRERLLEEYPGSPLAAETRKRLAPPSTP